MSRATVDIQAVRVFLGYGLVFFSQNVLSARDRAGRAAACLSLGADAGRNA